MKRLFSRAPASAARSALALGVLAGILACAPAAGADVLQQALQAAGADPAAQARTAQLRAASPTAARRLPLLRALLDEPLRASYRIGLLGAAIADERDSALGLMHIVARLAGADDHRPPPGLAAQAGSRADDALAAALAAIAQSAGAPPPAPEATPSAHLLPPPLRDEVARVLASVARAERFRQRAFAAFSPAASPERLVRQAVDGERLPFEEPDFRHLLTQLDRQALHAGMIELSAATQALVRFLLAGTQPAAKLRFATALGEVVIDTGRSDDVHTPGDVVLLIDGGGDDLYRFQPRSAHSRIGIVVDVAGNDRYRADAPASGPAAAVLGYSLLWDAAGDDRYGEPVASALEPGARAQRITQGAALFGAALLVDGGGDDRYHALSHAQGWALGGSALLVEHDGDDEFHALAFAQGSAGPEGVAVLVDGGGSDRYTLAATPLLLPSTQLPERNLSMGQGAAMGDAGADGDGRLASGGIGALFDLGGDDHYQAQLFAQGAGYHEALGILVDGGGSDRFDAAWYAMGAAAHRAAGVLLKRGEGSDRYHASHSTAIGAAHDLSVAFFLDEGGDDHYLLGDLGLGAAHDNSSAVFVDVAGEDGYQVRNARCLAFGAAHQSGWGTLREDLANVGLFLDLGGRDRYRSQCAGPRNDAQWSWPRQHPTLALPSESGAGIDGAHPNPFLLAPRTRPAAPGAEHGAGASAR